MNGLSRKLLVYCGATAALTAMATPAAAQSSFEDAVRQLNSQNARGYIQPFADLFAADMASGWYHTGSVGSNSVSLGIEFVGAAARVEDKHRTYTMTAPSGFTPSEFTTATVFGGTGTEVDGPGGTSFRGSDGIFDADYLPSVVPQLRVGLSSAEITLRYFSTSMFSFGEEDEFPEVTLMGLGLRHGISRYLPGIPVDLAVGVFLSRIDVGSSAAEGISAEQTTVSLGVQASRTMSLLTLYGGLASDGGSMSVNYRSTDPESPGAVSSEIDIKRSMRFTAGASLDFGILSLFGDVNLGPATTFSGGLRLGR